MFEIVFPEHKEQRYWHIHFEYLLNIFKYLDCKISYEERPDLIVTIDGQDFLFDYWDSSNPRESQLPTFKFHTKREDLGRVIPFAPVSFYNWDRYYQLEKEITYKANGYLTSRQRPYAGALERRTRIQRLLHQMYSNVETEVTEQEAFWKEISNIFLPIFVPGQNNNIYDRAHAQYLAFGSATVSPHLPEILPFNKCILGDYHYIGCDDDYSDLTEIIEHSHTEKDFLLDVGRNAKKLFQETSTPQKLGEWIGKHLK